ncbi:hypothetical protein ACTXT7_017369 [Hymenolepis weldensis]
MHFDFPLNALQPKPQISQEKNILRIAETTERTSKVAHPARIVWRSRNPPQFTDSTSQFI